VHEVVEAFATETNEGATGVAFDLAGELERGFVEALQEGLGVVGHGVVEAGDDQLGVHVEGKVRFAEDTQELAVAGVDDVLLGNEGQDADYVLAVTQQ
jgi:hypothetical protein